MLQSISGLACECDTRLVDCLAPVRVSSSDLIVDGGQQSDI